MSSSNTTPAAVKGRRHGRGGDQPKSLLLQNYPLRYLVPAYAVLLVFFFLPTILNFIYAFTNWSAFSNT